jgi:hypothetical protein
MSKELHMAAECMLFEELGPDEFEAALMKFAALVRADEREACAQLAEDTNRMVLALLNVTSQPKHIAAAIRARSNT